MPTYEIAINEEMICIRYINRVTTTNVIVNVNESTKYDNKQNHVKLQVYFV